MLARPETNFCVECRRRYGDPGFWYYYGRIEDGPAYFCDEGILCSPACSMKQIERRRAAGTYPHAPARDPFEA
ncbi:MAG: hypothetical protein ACT6QU_13975 [Aliihoeflea sp.]|uniref:hypothetical protein n=1 Tax=Aliihoeflea sp. TaxID=2608088 RepID=UPI004033D67C